MNHDFPQIEILKVSATGAISLEAAGVPYSCLQWSRKMGTCGTFSATLSCDLPMSWPGRYLVTVSGRPEVGIVEKVGVEQKTKKGLPTIEGRFAESVWDKWGPGFTGYTAKGANWRQAVSAGMTAWIPPDLPPISKGSGMASATGSSYALGVEPSQSPMGILYSATYGNGALPVVSYDRAGDPTHLKFDIRMGLDRTRSQNTNPWWVFSLDLGSINSIGYTGDYSPSCSEITAHADWDDNGETRYLDRTIPVSGFNAATMWKGRAYEDVGSLLDRESTPTAAAVDSAGRLRTYDHMPAISVDAKVAPTGYMVGWDLGDLCEVEVPALSIVATERVEEVHEVFKPTGHTIEATLGTKQMTRIDRALIGRR